mmetsp:Transcript_23843/g.56810  ORF Transcript_23843/g.56810 Transcript_23843/m.56810 type:complete len:284 (-) Transcript_23843:195-1046(-)
MYSGNLLCQAAAAIVQNATQDRVTVKMLKTFEEKLEFYFPVVENWGYMIYSHGFIVLQRAGGSPPQNYWQLHMEMHQLGMLAKNLCRKGQDALRCGSKSAKNYISQLYSSICEHTSLLWQVCRVELEEWLFQCRKHVNCPAYLKFMESMKRSLRSSKMICNMMAVGLCFSTLEEARFSDIVQVLAGLGFKDCSAKLRALFVLASVKFYKKSFIRPLQELRDSCHDHTTSNQSYAVAHDGNIPRKRSLCSRAALPFRHLGKLLCKLKGIKQDSVHPVSEISNSS